MRDLTFQLGSGRSLGFIGPNGAGKSTSLKLMARILAPDAGTVRVRGRVASLIELGAGFHHEYTGRENVYLNASLLGLSRREVDRLFDDIVAFAELEHAIDDQVRTYSSGMYMRLGFAVAIHVDPELLLVDEILAVGDAAFQRKCVEWLAGFRRRGGTLVLVSHNLVQVRDMCEEAIWIQHGDVQAQGPAGDVVDAYLQRVDLARDEALRLEGGRLAGLPAYIESARLVGPQGRVDRLAAGDPLTVEAVLRVNRPIDRPVLGVALVRGDGLVILATNTELDRAPLGRLEQDCVVRLEYGSLNLLDGTYRVAAAIFEQDLTLLNEQAMYVEVRSGGGRVEGVVDLDRRWRVEPLPLGDAASS